MLPSRFRRIFPGPAPQARERAAEAVLWALVSGQAVSCEERNRNRDKSIVAICYAGGYDLAAGLMRQGHALAYTRHSRQYLAQERGAKAARRGLWAGSFIEPEAWRTAQRR